MNEPRPDGATPVDDPGLEETRLFFRTDEGIFVTTLDGLSQRVQLSLPLLVGGAVASNFRLSPDGRRVVYAADLEGDGTVELYSRKTDGSDHAKLNGALTPGGSVGTVFEVADSGRVVFYAEQDYVDGHELHAVNLDGSDRVAVEEDGLVTGFRVTADGRVVYVLYRGDQGYDLYASGLDGKGRVKLASHAGYGTSLLLTPDASHVVYLGQTNNGWPSIYASRLDGSGTVTINPPTFEGMPFDPSVTADGTRVVYRAILDDHRLWKLYASSLDGTSTVKLNGSGGVGWFRLIPGDRVLYVADQDADGAPDLYASQLDGSGNVKVSHALEGSAIGEAIEVSADGSRVVYRVGDPQANASRLYASNTDGSGTVKLIDDHSRFHIVDREGTRVVVLRITAGFDLHVIHIADDGNVSSVQLEKGGSLFPLLSTPDGERVLFRGPEDPSGATRLYVVRLDGSGAIDLNLTLPKLGSNDLNGSFVLR